MLNLCFILIFLILFIAFSSKIYNTNIKDKDSAAHCDICQFWIHMKCNNLNHIDYKYVQGSNDPWFCISCCNVPFGTLTRKNFLSMMMVNSSPITFKNSDAVNIKTNSFLTLKASANLSLLFNLFNNFSP